LEQKLCFWLTGLPSSGKTTLGFLLKKKFVEEKIPVTMIDGDEIRNNICSDLGFSDEDRKENIRRAALLAKSINSNGEHAICCFVSPTNEIRDIARNIIGSDNFVEVFIDSSVNVCEQRDLKGLYKKAREGIINDLTGIGAPYEPPLKPDLQIKTDTLTINQSFLCLFDGVMKIITKRNR